MLKEHVKLIHKVAIIIDSIVIGVAFLIADVVSIYFQHKIHDMPGVLDVLPPLSHYILLLTVVVPTWIIALSYSGIYREMREKRFVDIFLNIFSSAFLSTLILSAVLFLLQLEIVSSLFVLMFVGCAVSLLVIEKSSVLALLHYIRLRGYNVRIILIVGTGERVKNFIRTVSTHPYWGFKIVGLVDEADRVGMTIEGYHVIGSLDDIPEILKNNVIDEVIFILPRRFLNRLESYIRICENIGVTATIPVDFFNTLIAKPTIAKVHGWPLLMLKTIPLNNLDFTIKRFMDIVVSISGLILLMPVFLIISLLIKLTSEGPVFFKQIRCGLNGRKFVIYKFRTMVVNAEEKLEELKMFNEREGPVFKMKNDPRIIGIGRFLRKTSLDELPQLINVLKGDMSLIGPRPSLPVEVAKYEQWQRRRLSLRPGMACIHEVVARNDRNFHNWMKLDLDYIDNWSLSLDVRIMLNIILSPFKAKGV